jgi:hypothetical protein
MNARRTRGHASEAREASIYVQRVFGCGCAILLQHLLDQVDASARAIELVTKEHVGRARRRAEAAVNARAQDLVGNRDVRVGKLGEGKVRLHARAKV